MIGLNKGFLQYDVIKKCQTSVYIRDFLGHTSVMTTEIYARTNPKIKEEQLSRNSKKITPGESYTVKEKDDLIDWLKKNL